MYMHMQNSGRDVKVKNQLHIKVILFKFLARIQNQTTLVLRSENQNYLFFFFFFHLSELHLRHILFWSFPRDYNYVKRSGTPVAGC